MATSEQKAVAEFAKGILAYVEDGNVVEVHECGFVDELRRAIADGGLGTERDDDVPTFSAELSMLFRAEINNEADGGDSPTTFGSAWDSVQQMTDEVLAEYIEEDADSKRIGEVREELRSLKERYGYDYEVEPLLD